MVEMEQLTMSEVSMVPYMCVGRCTCNNVMELGAGIVARNTESSNQWQLTICVQNEIELFQRDH